MKERTAGRLALGGWIIIVALAGLSFALIAITETSGDPTRYGPQGFDGALVIVLGTVGAAIASRRRENPIGWLFLGIGLLGSVNAVGAEYGTYAYFEGHGWRQLGHIGAWLPNWVWLLLIGPLFTILPLTFPDGRLRSPRWRVALGLAIVAMVTGAVGFALTPRIEGEFGVGNPFGLEAEQPWLAMGYVGAGLLLVAAIASAISLILRYRAAFGEERAQMKWLVYSAAVASVTLAFGFLNWDPGQLIQIGGFFLIPISVAVAILRYRLYDIDLVINKTVVLAALAAFITAVYVAIVVGIGAAVGQGDEPNVLLSILATAVVAVAFQPVRARAHRLADRLVYGKRANPFEVLSDFSHRIGGAYSTEDFLPRMARIVAEGAGAARAEVWLRVGDGLVPAASWPQDEQREERPVGLSGDRLPALPRTDRSFPIRHQGELLGALAVDMPPREPLAPSQENLLAGVAAQAGLVLRNVRLTAELQARLEEISAQAAELRASRQRIVAAQDQERRRLERDIHDGAQQELVALSVRIRLAEGIAAREAPQLQAALAELRQVATEALENLRDLARGIYPPLLADHGLGPALEAQARKVPLPVVLDLDGVGRFSQEQEAAVYFCCLEALQNVAKYARASRVTVRVWARNGELGFSVEDDGVGFDPEAARGSGLQNMLDRMSALGGTLAVRSEPGRGTTVTGTLPAKPPEQAGGAPAEGDQRTGQVPRG